MHFLFITRFQCFSLFVHAIMEIKVFPLTEIEFLPSKVEIPLIAMGTALTKKIFLIDKKFFFTTYDLPQKCFTLNRNFRIFNIFTIS